MRIMPITLAGVGVLVASALASGAPPAFDTDATWIEAPEGSPVIDRGPEGAWDAYAVDNPFLFVEDGTLYCFFEAQDRPFDQGGHEQVGLAISRDGVRWEKLAHNPILRVGIQGSWDSVVAKLPVVARHEGKYYLFYSGRDGKTKQIGLATSTDLLHWTKHEANPVLEARPDCWDRFLSTHPAPPFERDGRFYLLYRGMQALYQAQGLGVAVSADMVHWQRLREGPVIPPTEEVASLAMACTEEGFVGIAQAPDRAYWFTTDLVNWEKRGVPRFTGKNVTTVSNPVVFKGQWLIVYEQDDRIYRAVLK